LALSNLKSVRQRTYPLDILVRLVDCEQVGALRRHGPAFREAAGVERGALLRGRGGRVGGHVDVREGGGVLFVVVEGTAEGGAAEDGLDELVLAEGFREVVLWRLLVV
jgi:hypothetical protein